MGGNGARARVLVLAPSTGLGGGIERYVEGVVDALRAADAEVHRVDLLHEGEVPTPRRRAAFAAAAVAAAVRHRRADCVLVAHPNLLPVGAAVAAVARPVRCRAVFHGTDIWVCAGVRSRLAVRAGRMEPVTVSTFSAGALAAVGRAAVLPPNLTPAWRSTLIAAGRARRPATGPPTVLTVFRLSQYRQKGLPELVEAVRAVRSDLGPLRLVVAGQGPAPAPLRALVAGLVDAELHESPADGDLAGLYAAADVFALCTRTRARPPLSGEGYGIVLLEAQLAGCAVVGPASGGSRDAYQEGLTGRTPPSETSCSLAGVLARLLSDRDALSACGRRAAAWAAAATDPAAYRERVVATVLGE